MKKTTRTTLAMAGAALALALAGGAQAADQKYEKQAATMCADGSHATDKNGCEKNGGIKPTPTKADGMAVETQSSKVSKTGDAPSTGSATKTPAKPDPTAK